MDYSKKVSTSVSALFVAVLAIITFVRGELQLWLLGAAFLLWGIWVLVPLLLNAKRKRAYQHKKQQIPRQKEFIVPTLEEPSEGLLQRHVGYRISAYLKSAYPAATWDWCEKDPERIIQQGGTARIRLFDVPDFNYASIIFDNRANIGCDMMRIVPLAEVSGMPVGTQTQPSPPSKQEPTDPQVWYEMQGRKVLENLIADLHSRGHSSLTIKDNGEICITQDNTVVTTKTLQSLPAKTYWQALIKVFEKEGLAAAITDEGLAVTW